MKKDVDKWVQNCITCVRFRKITTKTQQVAVIPVDAECWQEVMMDLEGPNTPADKDGRRYNSTYVCCVCHAVLLEGLRVANALLLRRAFASSMFRAGRIPDLIRSDQGPEFKNEPRKSWECWFTMW